LILEKSLRGPMPSHEGPDVLEDYDFSKGVRGKYTERYREGTSIVRLDDDVAAMFPDAKSVNDALRALTKIINQHEKRAKRMKE